MIDKSEFETGWRILDRKVDYTDYEWITSLRFLKRNIKWFLIHSVASELGRCLNVKVKCNSNMLKIPITIPF